MDQNFELNWDLTKANTITPFKKTVHNMNDICRTFAISAACKSANMKHEIQITRQSTDDMKHG